MKDRIAKSVFWIVWSKGGVQGIGLLSTLFIARLLTPADYGLVSLAAIWIYPIAMLAEMGLGAAIVQFRDITDKELNGCFWLINSIALFGYFVLYVSAPVIAQWFEAPMLSPVLRVNGILLPLTAIRVVPDSLLRKNLALDKISKAEIVGAVLTIPTMLALALAGAGVWTLVGGMLMSSLAQTAMTFWFLPWRPGWTVGGERIIEVLRFSVSTLGSKLCWATYRQADFFVLGKVSGDVVLGFYSMAKQLATLPVDKISTVVNQLASPIMAELQDKRSAMQVSLLRGLRLVALIAFPMCIGLLLVADDLIRVLLTDKWSEAVPALQILCLYAFIRSLDILLPPVLMARFRAKFLFSYTFALLAFMPLAFLAGAIWGGAIGVAIAWVTVYPIFMLRMAQEAFLEVGLSWRNLLKQLSSTLGATATMATVLSAIAWGLSAWSHDMALIRLLLMVITGMIVYTGSLFLMDGTIYEELRQVIWWALGKGHLKRPKALATA
jgi:O-antigen/teichoic acid export membrane protein